MYRTCCAIGALTLSTVTPSVAESVELCDSVVRLSVNAADCVSESAEKVAVTMTDAARTLRLILEMAMPVAEESDWMKLLCAASSKSATVPDTVNSWTTVRTTT